MSTPGNNSKGGARVAPFSDGAWVSTKGGNRLVDAINGNASPPRHGQEHEERSPEPWGVYRIVSSSQDSDGNYRWEYTVLRQQKSGSKWAGWIDDPSASNQKGYNVIEVPNAADNSSGQVLSGITMDDSVTGISAIKNDALVIGRIWSCTDEENSVDVEEVWFEAGNEPLITCSDDTSGDDTLDGGGA